MLTNGITLGDFNRDGTVDAADYTLWRKTLGSDSNLYADGSGNGVVDMEDYHLWRAYFGHTAATSSIGTQSVPEPSAVWLLLLGGSFVGLRGRR